MINRFLKAKHWQLFIFMIGIPLIFQIILVQQMFSTAIENSGENMNAAFDNFKYFPIIMILWIGLFYGWMWSIGVGLGNKLSEEIKLNTKWFKIAIIIPVVYIIFISFFMTTFFSGVMSFEREPGFSSYGLILPFHFLSIICNFYAFYFVAKTIKTAESNRSVRFSDFVGEFLLMWFFIIGIWILQPRINKLAEKQEDISEIV